MLELWYKALGSAHGIAIETDDAVALRAALYRARKDDPDLKPLKIRVISPTELHICHVKVPTL